MPVRYVLAGGLAVLVGLLAVLAWTPGLGAFGLLVGLGCGLGLLVAVGRGTAAYGAGVMGPAGLVTLTRAVMACALAGVVVDVLVRSTPGVVLGAVPWVVVALAGPALALDAVDGWLARRTGTVSAFGARFDGEADAFLILVLSVSVVPVVGLWVGAIGAARYVFGAAGWVLPWLRAPLPPRRWRKVVAAVQGVVLACAAAGVVSGSVAVVALVVALVLLTESFGRDVWWLWRRRAPQRDGSEAVRGAGAVARVPVS